MKISKELLKKVVSEIDGNIQITADTIHYSLGTHMGSMLLDTLLRKLKDWMMDFNNLQGLSSHNCFYTQTDGREWYAGFSHLKTTYGDKATLKDLGKGKTEIEAVVDMMEEIIKDVK